MSLMGKIGLRGTRSIPSKGGIAEKRGERFPDIQNEGTEYPGVCPSPPSLGSLYPVRCRVNGFAGPVNSARPTGKRRRTRAKIGCKRGNSPQVSSIVNRTGRKCLGRPFKNGDRRSHARQNLNDNRAFRAKTMGRKRSGKSPAARSLGYPKRNAPYRHSALDSPAGRIRTFKLRWNSAASLRSAVPPHIRYPPRDELPAAQTPLSDSPYRYRRYSWPA